MKYLVLFDITLKTRILVKWKFLSHYSTRTREANIVVPILKLLCMAVHVLLSFSCLVLSPFLRVPWHPALPFEMLRIKHTQRRRDSETTTNLHELPSIKNHKNGTRQGSNRFWSSFALY